eukprot:1158049-Pelagomonas_calceolata.AAC.7
MALAAFTRLRVVGGNKRISKVAHSLTSGKQGVVHIGMGNQPFTLGKQEASSLLNCIFEWCENTRTHTHAYMHAYTRRFPRP